MGACCSKTDTTITSTPTPPELPPEKKPNTAAAAAIVAPPTPPEAINKDVFVVKNSKSHETDRHPDQETHKSTDRKKMLDTNPNGEISKLETSSSAGDGGVLSGETGKLIGVGTVRTSSCSKEEVEAILIQCGRLSRSSSVVKPETPTRGRRYSGSKRSFDFDMEVKNEDEEGVGDGGSRRQVREPRVSSPSRRRSRERDPLQQRSGSKERGSGERRRVSRSPNRRSESPNPNSVAAGGSGSGSRPGKMVSVPATDKGNNAGGGEVVAGVGGGVKKVQVKRNAGEVAVAVGSWAAASPRSRSPANIKVLNENQNQQQLILSRSNSRKAEHSPHRRNPLGEIDSNVVGSEQPGSKIVSRTRSSRLSRDLDISPETFINPNPPSYASLLLEDIQNFHQKNLPTAAAAPAFPLPASVTKACTILEAVADLKSATSSNDQQLKVVNDDLMEPSLHKYVTVRRGGGDADNDEQESSGSNSFAGSQRLSWMSSSWEPSSGDSTDCWTSKLRSDARDVEVERSGEYPRNGIGRGRVGIHGRSAYSLPNDATVAST